MNRIYNNLEDSYKLNEMIFCKETFEMAYIFHLLAWKQMIKEQPIYEKENDNILHFAVQFCSGHLLMDILAAR